MRFPAIGWSSFCLGRCNPHSCLGPCQPVRRSPGPAIPSPALPLRHAQIAMLACPGFHAHDDTADDDRDDDGRTYEHT